MMSLKKNQVLFKEVMSNYPTGVTILTAIDSAGNPVGLTVNSFASVSMDPLLVLWSIDHKVSSFDTFIKAKRFAVHVLADDQQELCKTFANKRVKNAERFGLCNWELSNYNLPIILGSSAVLKCKILNRIEAGDHSILIGEVYDANIEKKAPMLYFQRNFTSIPAELNNR